MHTLICTTIIRYATLKAESIASTLGHINFYMKLLRKRSAGNPHAAFEVAGAGNGKMVMATWARN
jgi:hypothetical protein